MPDLHLEATVVADADGAFGINTASIVDSESKLQQRGEDLPVKFLINLAAFAHVRHSSWPGAALFVQVTTNTPPACPANRCARHSQEQNCCVKTSPSSMASSEIVIVIVPQGPSATGFRHCRQRPSG